MRTRSWVEPIPVGAVGGAWVFPDHGLVYTVTSGDVASPRDVNALVDVFLFLSREMPQGVAPTIIHDWRSLTAVPRESRAVFLRRRRELETRPARVVIATAMNPLLRMALRTVALSAQLVAGTVELDLVRDPEPALRAVVGAAEPSAELHDRLRRSWKYEAAR